MQVIYLDVLFVVNLAINYILLLLTRELSGVYAKRINLVFGAFVGAVFSVMLFFCELNELFAAIIKLSLCVGIIIVAFGRDGKRKITRLSLIFCVISFALAGIILAIGLIRSSDFFAIKNGIPYIDISIKHLLIASVVAYILLTIVFGSGEVKIKRVIAHVEARLGNKTVLIKTFVDTGNLLREPISGKKIILVEKNIAAMLFEGNDAIEILKLDELSAISCHEKMSEKVRCRLGLISYSNSSKTSLLMLTVKVDCITVNSKIKNEYLIGISNVELSSACGCNAIIGV